MTGKAQILPRIPLVVSSLLWLNGERVVRLGVGVLQTALVARYLGPGWFGEISGSIALVSLFAGFSTLGLDSVLSRRLVLARADAGSLLATALILRVTAGGLVTLLLFGFSAGGEFSTVRMVVAFTAVAQSMQVGEAWFMSTGEQRKPALVRLSVSISSLLLRIGLVATGASAPAFALVIVGETALSALFVFAWARRETGQKFSPRWHTCGADMLRESWPVIIAMISVGVCTRIDLVIVSWLIPGEIAGSYAAAARLNEIFLFAASGIHGATVGLLVRLHGRDAREFRRIQSAIAGLAMWVGLVIAVNWFCFGEWAALVIFGQSYAGTGEFLRIIAWSNISVFAGSAWSVFWLANRMQAILMSITIISGLFTLGLSALLILRFEAFGAAWAVVIGQALPFVFLQRYPDARQAFGAMINSFVHPIVSVRVVFAWLKDSHAPERNLGL